ncbi:fatty acid hydroxylase domain-containing protein 2 [Aplochiton taeniatus]
MTVDDKTNHNGKDLWVLQHGAVSDAVIFALQEGSGGLWDSVKKAAFVIGSSLLLLAAFGNSLTWHLQKFWGASGDFWQNQWTHLLVTFEGHETALFYLGTMLAPMVTFWSSNALLLLVDTTGKPGFITRYRIQTDKNNPVDPVKLRHAIKAVFFNQIFVSGPMVVGVYYFMTWRGNPFASELPTFHQGLMELAFAAIVEEIMFYYSHRLFHHPALYKHFHKQHHEWTAPIGVVSIYAHPLEHFLSNMAPALMGPMLLGSHLATTSLWYCLALLSTTISHSGYHLPLLPSPEFHDYHHLKFNQNFGVLGVLDRLHGTDSKFRTTKAYERHTLLLNLTPLNQSIPEPPKKVQ